jgi:phosphatidylglycerophosphate synthase
LSVFEKRALIWMAHRLPAWVTSDRLSAMGLIAMIAAGMLLAVLPAAQATAGAVLCLAVNWFGDSLDGTLARVRGVERPRYGYYVDHAIDLAGTTCLLAGLGVSGLMHPLAAAGVLAGFLLVSAESYLAAHTIGIFRVSFLGCGPTELRILLAIGLLRAATTPTLSFGGHRVRLLDAGGAIGAAALAAVFVAASVRNVRALALAEPYPLGLKR